MRKTLITAVMAAVVVLAFMPAASQADPPTGTNLVGFYTDTDGQGLSNQDVALYNNGTAYLCLTGCEFDSILGWELKIRTEGVGLGINVTNWAPSGQYVNADSPPGFAVGLAAPLPKNAEGIIVLMEITVFVMEAGYLYLELPTIPSIADNMSMLDGNDVGNIVAIHHPLGDLAWAIFGINTGWIHPAVETATWGAVRSLYR